MWIVKGSHSRSPKNYEARRLHSPRDLSMAIKTFLSSNLLISYNPRLCLVSSSFIPFSAAQHGERLADGVIRFDDKTSAFLGILVGPQHVFVTHQSLNRFSFLSYLLRRETKRRKKIHINWNHGVEDRRLKSTDPRSGRIKFYLKTYGLNGIVAQRFREP